MPKLPANSPTSSELGLLRYRSTPATPTSKGPSKILEQQTFSIFRQSYPAGGVCSKKSADDLLRIGTINRRDLDIIATRVLIGGAIAHRVFNTSTAVKNWNSSW